MSKYFCSEEQFLDDVKEHTMTVIRDDGVDRHLQFRKKRSSFWFDIITWPGVLCIQGDMGTYVFTRLMDMFEFFRTDAKHKPEDILGINPSYWAEKLIAIDKGGYMEFDFDTCKKYIKEAYDNYCASNTLGKQFKEELWEGIEDDVLSQEDDGEHAFTRAIYEFRDEDFSFDDFFEHHLTRPTFHYIWCCMAIAWAIQQYDTHKLKETPA